MDSENLNTATLGNAITTDNATPNESGGNGENVTTESVTQEAQMFSNTVTSANTSTSTPIEVKNGVTTTDFYTLGIVLIFAIFFISGVILERYLFRRM